MNDRQPNVLERFLADRWSVAWVVSALVLLAVVLLVPIDEGWGPWVVAAVALVVIVISAKLRIRDAQADRRRKAEKVAAQGREGTGKGKPRDRA